MVLLLVLSVLFVAFGSLLGLLPAALALSLAIVLSFWSFWSDLSVAIEEANGVAVSDTELVSDTALLAARAGVPLPRLYVIKDPQANAFAIGRNAQSAVIILTDTLCRELTQNQVCAVVAHELAHIRNKDMLARSVATSLVGAIMLLAMLIGLVGLSMRRHGGIVIIALAVLAPIIAIILKLAISRSMEYRADRDAALLCGSPQHLIAALERLQVLTSECESNTALNRPALAALFVVDPLPHTLLGALFSPHPPIAGRIRRLEQMIYLD